MRFARATVIEVAEPTRTPEREALALAIEARTQAERAAKAAHEAAERARDVLFDAKTQLRALKSRTISLRDRGADRVDVSAAAADEARATRAAQAAEAAHQALDDALQPIERELRRATAAADKAARAVLSQSAEALLREAASSRARYLAALSALIAVETCVDPFAAGGTARADIRATLGRAESEIAYRLAHRHPVGDLWRVALAALLLDPDANLPPGGDGGAGADNA